MRQPTSNWRFSATVTLIIVLVAAFVLQHTAFRDHEGKYLALSLYGIKHGYLWQLLTFQFLHAGPLHLILNCVTLWMFGREVEEALDKPRFLTLYFLSGAIGGLLQVLLSLFWPNQFGDGVVGASAGIFGVVAAFSMLAPNRMLTMMLFFIIPVPMKAKVLVFISMIVAVLGIAFPETFGKNIAHGAHLGGILAGIAFMRYGGRLPERLWSPFQSQKRKRELIRAVSIKVPKWPQGRSENSGELSQDEFISREVDPILDKISQHGIQSLTERERKILEAARNKMAKR
jgi:membrane associated rhomboid family serine protease